VNPESRKAAEYGELRGWRRAQGLADDVRYYGKWMRDEAEKRIGHLYPKVKITKEMAKERPDLKEHVGGDLTVIAWLWARTVNCPNPACEARIPLVRSFWLSTKPGNFTVSVRCVDQIVVAASGCAASSDRTLLPRCDAIDAAGSVEPVPADRTPTAAATVD
jgi:adenine-specific DNA methylase